jgi:hypothetical protein
MNQCFRGYVLTREPICQDGNVAACAPPLRLVVPLRGRASRPLHPCARTRLGREVTSTVMEAGIDVAPVDIHRTEQQAVSEPEVCWHPRPQGRRRDAGGCAATPWTRWPVNQPVRRADRRLASTLRAAAGRRVLDGTFPVAPDRPRSSSTVLRPRPGRRRRSRQPPAGVSNHASPTTQLGVAHDARLGSGPPPPWRRPSSSHACRRRQASTQALPWVAPCYACFPVLDMR